MSPRPKVNHCAKISPREKMSPRAKVFLHAKVTLLASCLGRMHNNNVNKKIKNV